MPSSAVRTFTDPDEYAAVIRQGTVEPTTTGHGQFTAKLTRIDLHRLWMQRFEQNLSQILHVDGWGGRVSFTFRTHPGPHLFAGGFEYQPTNIVRPGPGQGYFIRSSGAFRLGAMSLPMEDLSSIGVLAGVDVTRSRDAMLLTPPPTAMARLQRLHATAAGLAEDAPEIIAHPEAASSLEQALIQAMADCLATREGRKNTLAQGQHAIVMRRFRRVVEENPEEPLYIPEICKAIRVSPRALLLCCQEHLGMGPKRYLLLRRMHLVRRALRQATPGTTSVTEIATRHGFWQLGRFAVKYHSLFGESPSATLHGLSA